MRRLRANPQFAELCDQPQRFRIKIELSEKFGGAWVHDTYRMDAEWSAPASMIKLPIALLALHRVQQLAALGASLDCQLKINDPHPCGAQASELAEFETVRRSIERMLIVSDNGASNRMFEFIGHDRLPSSLRRFGFADATLQARLGACSPEDNAKGRGWWLHDAHGKLLIAHPHQAIVSLRAITPEPLVGRGYYDFNDALVAQPRSFGFSNDWHLQHSHELMLAIAGAIEHPLFNGLTPEHQAFVRDTLARLPPDAGFDAQTFPDNWGKLLVTGNDATLLRQGLRIHNKIGQAYGFLSDCAWIRYGDKELVMSASIYVNADEILNDDKYEYDTLGIPFLTQIGRLALGLD